MRALRWILPVSVVVVVPRAEGRIVANGYSARTRAAECQIDIFDTGLEVYQLEVGRLPTEKEGLQALIIRPNGASGWNGPYLRKSFIPLDPWGNQYIYRNPGTSGSFEVISPAHDRKVGTADDINNWDDTKPWRRVMERHYSIERWIRGVDERALLALIALAVILVRREGEREQE